MQGKKTGGGSRKGIPNKSTITCRQAVALIADGRAAQFVRWLDKIAEGETITEVLDDGSERTIYTRPPNPEAAAKLYLATCEYYIPKMQRTELHADGDTRAALAGGKIEIVFALPAGTQALVQAPQPSQSPALEFVAST